MTSSVYLNPREGVCVSGDLLDILEEHPEIEVVILFWYWTEDFFTSNASVFPAFVSKKSLDEEYSFFGNREKAIEFARNYDCWDGDDFVIMNSKYLYSYHSAEDMQVSWNDGYDHIGGLSYGIDPSWISMIRVDFDYKTQTEYLLEPEHIPRSR